MCELFISISDREKWQITESNEQALLIQQLIDQCVNLGESNVSPITLELRQDCAEAQCISNLTGLSIPLIISSAGYFLKHLSPLIVAFMKMRGQKEISITHRDTTMTVKGGGDFEKDLEIMVGEINSMEKIKIKS